jgi:hypothetical protein
MKWVLIALGGACVIGLILLVREVRSGGGSGEPAKSAKPEERPAPPAPAADDLPRPGKVPAKFAPDVEVPEVVDVEPPEPEDDGPTSPELAAAQAAAERIEDDIAPRELRRIAMQCEQPGQKLEGTMYLTMTLDSGNGQVRVEQLTIKDSSLTDPQQQQCVRARLENARWQQPDAPDRRWRIAIALALPE